MFKHLGYLFNSIYIGVNLIKRYRTKTKDKKTVKTFQWTDSFFFFYLLHCICWHPIKWWNTSLPTIHIESKSKTNHVTRAKSSITMDICWHIHGILVIKILHYSIIYLFCCDSFVRRRKKRSNFFHSIVLCVYGMWSQCLDE